MIKEFKEFILRGNVLDLAVGVVIGSAFTAIVNQIVEGLITPLIGLVVSLITRGNTLESSLSVLKWEPVNDIVFHFDSVISAIITFLITGFVLFLIVKAANRAKTLTVGEAEEEEEAPSAEDYLAEIRDLLAAQQQTDIEEDPTKRVK